MSGKIALFLTGFSCSALWCRFRSNRPLRDRDRPDLILVSSPCLKGWQKFTRCVAEFWVIPSIFIAKSFCGLLPPGQELDINSKKYHIWSRFCHVRTFCQVHDLWPMNWLKPYSIPSPSENETTRVHQTHPRGSWPWLCWGSYTLSYDPVQNWPNTLDDSAGVLSLFHVTLPNPFFWVALLKCHSFINSAWIDLWFPWSNSSCNWSMPLNQLKPGMHLNIYVI